MVSLQKQYNSFRNGINTYMECAIMCCTCHTLTRSREIVLFFPLVKILQSDGSNYVILVMGKVSYYQIVIDHHELLE